MDGIEQENGAVVELAAQKIPSHPTRISTSISLREARYLHAVVMSALLTSTDLTKLQALARDPIGQQLIQKTLGWKRRVEEQSEKAP